MSTFIDLFYTCIDQVWTWANDIYDHFDLSFAGILLSFIIVGAMVRYLIRPFVGSAGGSDRVKKGDKHADNT